MNKNPSLKLDDCLTIIFKPTSCCNLKCKYCFSHENRDKHRQMSISEIYESIDWVVYYVKYRGYKAVTWLWHGGEPMLIGVKLFSELTEYVLTAFKKINVKVLLSLQTNLTLYTADWLGIITKYYKNNIGVSLDYMTEARCDINGNFYEKQILEAIKSLHNNGVEVSGILSLVTPKNVNLVNEMYQFYKENELSFQTSRYFPSTTPLECEKAYVLSDMEYANFLIKLFDIWFDDPDPQIEILNLREMAVGLINGVRNLCIAQKGGCTQRIICIEAGGEIYNCGRYDSANFLIGTIKEDVKKISDSIGLRAHYSLPKHCYTCKYFKLCNGGCRYERDINGKFINCKVDQKILKHIEKRLLASGCKLADLTGE